MTNAKRPWIFVGEWKREKKKSVLEAMSLSLESLHSKAVRSQFLECDVMHSVALMTKHLSKQLASALLLFMVAFFKKEVYVKYDTEQQSFIPTKHFRQLKKSRVFFKQALSLPVWPFRPSSFVCFQSFSFLSAHLPLWGNIFSPLSCRDWEENSGSSVNIPAKKWVHWTAVSLKGYAIRFLLEVWPNTCIKD